MEDVVTGRIVTPGNLVAHTKVVQANFADFPSGQDDIRLGMTGAIGQLVPHLLLVQITAFRQLYFFVNGRQDQLAD
jgi:hypothetical protein